MRSLLMMLFLVACADGGPGLGNDRHDAALPFDGAPVLDGGLDGCACEGLLVCLDDGGCGTCGGADEPCCGEGGCEAGLVCGDGTCTSCGGPGDACCLGDVPCPSGGVCIGGLCRDEIGPDPCSSPSRECDVGETDQRPCGSCGMQERGCDETCRWEEWSSCEGEGGCEPGSVTSEGCGACTARTCSGTCDWETTCDTCTCAEMVVCTVDTCPPGFHIAETLCIPGCGGFCDPAVNANAVRCAPNCASSFTTCGRTCPEGYYVYSRSCELSMPLQCVEHSCSHPDQNAVECRRIGT